MNAPLSMGNRHSKNALPSRQYRKSIKQLEANLCRAEPIIFKAILHYKSAKRDLAILVGAVESIQRLSQSFVVFDSKDANVGVQGGQRRTKDANSVGGLADSITCCLWLSYV
jgi:hypothetical protein